MPCYDGRENSEEYKREQALYGSAATPLLCEACEILEREGLLDEASPELLAFYEKHTADDLDRLRRAMKSAEATGMGFFLATLTQRDRRLLGLKPAA